MKFKVGDKVILTNFNIKLNGTLWTVIDLKYGKMFDYVVTSNKHGSMTVFERELIPADYQENCETIKSLLGVK